MDQEPGIRDCGQLKRLWTEIYDERGRPDWSEMLRYYHRDILFRDSVQTIRGLRRFTAMTARLARRSGNLKMTVNHVAREDNVFLLEWVLTMRFRRLPESSIFGATRLTVDSLGKIIEQRDYYDLWGDIFDNIPLLGRVYRRLMHLMFG